MSKRRQVVIVLHGPSGVGKDSVIDGLRSQIDIHRPTSSTSRLPRKDEEHGHHYHFLSRDEFERKVAAGDFVEFALVYNDYKGLERKELLASLDGGKDVIIRTDVQGARAYREKLRGAVFVFLDAEDRDILRARLNGRDSEDEKSLRERIEQLDAELADRKNNDYIVVNRNGRLDETVSRLAEIIEAERANPQRPDVALLE